MEPNQTPDALDWLEGSASFFPSFLDYPYSSNDIQDYQLWDQGQDILHYHQTDPNTGSPNAATIATTTATATSTTCTTPQDPEPQSYNNQPLFDLPKKRNAGCGGGGDQYSGLKPSQNHKAKKFKADSGDTAVAEGTSSVRKSGGNKKGKNSGNGCNNGNSKEGRWAEQLLNPCALAITGGNLNRVQHLLYVLHELASPAGDANHRLAEHGLRALTHHLSSSSGSTSSISAATSSASMTFASTEPRFFQNSLLKFYEVSPWFSFPNNIANASILQFLAEESSSSRTLHILDIGVSHGVQWPTLLEALSRRPGGPPQLVRLTVVAAASSNENEKNMETPFSVGPPGDNYSSRLLGYAQSIKVNLQINRVENLQLQKLNSQSVDTSPDETFIVCAQFRLHHLNHNNPDERSEFLKALRSMEPNGVILSENNTECCCDGCGDFAAGFSRRVEYLWRFLDSTSSAFKGRESDERRVMEGEAAKALINRREMNEGKEKWDERMKEAGFVGEILGEDTIDGARALLRKYDSNWEMRVEEDNKTVGLWWKGQPVSFCSLWKLDGEEEHGRSSSTLNSRL